jgi:hypothetical protein
MQQSLSTHSSRIKVNIPTILTLLVVSSGVPEGGGFGVFKPPPDIPKALQNRAKLNPIVKAVKNCWI